MMRKKTALNQSAEDKFISIVLSNSASFPCRKIRALESINKKGAGDLRLTCSSRSGVSIPIDTPKALHTNGMGGIKRGGTIRSAILSYSTDLNQISLKISLGKVCATTSILR